MPRAQGPEARGEKKDPRNGELGDRGQGTGARGARGPGIRTRGARGQWPGCRGVRGPRIRFGKPGEKGQLTGAQGARELGMRSRGVRGQGTGPEEPRNRGLEPKARDKVLGSPGTMDRGGNDRIQGVVIRPPTALAEPNEG